jgi:hypothetical protein
VGRLSTRPAMRRTTLETGHGVARSVDENCSARRQLVQVKAVMRYRDLSPGTLAAAL